MSIRSVARAVFGAVFVILPVSAFAQEIGVKAGANFASFPPEEDEPPDIPPRLGTVGGIWVRDVARPSRFVPGRRPVLGERHALEVQPGRLDRDSRSLPRDSAAGTRRRQRPGLEYARLRHRRWRAGVQAVGSCLGRILRRGSDPGRRPRYRAVRPRPRRRARRGVRARADRGALHARPPQNQHRRQRAERPAQQPRLQRDRRLPPPLIAHDPKKSPRCYVRLAQRRRLRRTLLIAPLADAVT